MMKYLSIYIIAMKLVIRITNYVLEIAILLYKLLIAI